LAYHFKWAPSELWDLDLEDLKMWLEQMDLNLKALNKKK